MLLKIMVCVYRSSDGINIRRSYQHQKINNMCYTLKPPDHTLKLDEQNLRIKHSNSDQDPNKVISTQKREHKGKNTLIIISRTL